MGNIKINQKDVNIGRDQVIAGGNINFGDVHNKNDYLQQMENLVREFAIFAQNSGLDEEKFIDIESKLRLAAAEVKKEKPSKKSLLDRLNGAKSILDGIASASGVVTAIAAAVEAAQKLF